METQGPAESIIPRNRYLALAALIVMGFSLLELASGVGLLGNGFLGSSASTYFSSARVVSLMTSLGYFSLFTLMTLESASVPIPSEVVLPFAGYLSFIGVMNVISALVLSTSAALLGALIDYVLALKLGNAFVEVFIRRLGMNHRSLETAEDWFRRRGAWTVFGARFVPVVRSVISLPAGLFRMRLLPFVIYTVGGCLAWNAVLIYAGYTAGAVWQSAVGDSFSVFVNLVLAAFVVVTASYLLYFAYGVTKG